MIARMLLKSWAIPLANWPSASSFWFGGAAPDLIERRSHALRSVISRVTPAKPIRFLILIINQGRKLLRHPPNALFMPHAVIQSARTVSRATRPLLNNFLHQSQTVSVHKIGNRFSPKFLRPNSPILSRPPD
jgi:hypothetical protein